MGLYKRGKVWWMAISHQGKQIRRPTGTSNRRLAEAILAKVTVRIVEGHFFDTLEEKERTFAEMMERYVNERSIKKAAGSIQRDQQCLKHLLPHFGEKVLVEVTPRLISAYKTKRQQEGAAPATLNKELGLMKASFNVAIREWEWCRENPVQRVAMEPVYNQIDRWLSADEEKQLLDASPTWLKEIILFALNTGMRRGEILSLQWQDVDFLRGVLVVMKSKNRERRTIPLNGKVLELLMAKEAVGKKRGLVFHSLRGTKINAQNLLRAFYAAKEKTKIGNFRFHDLRHTFATRLAQAGVDLYKVQRLLGHKTPAMTQRYAHHSPESLRDGVAVLDQMDAKEPAKKVFE
ncbi:MAG: tyrosine-type recombinase/integrase [Nitrospiria bacterium]